ncbi:MAG: hypothetical protein UY48_C0004G0025 [Candidatus Gottesmanbacteria bacterium GW2011_GWB1_49_7]|uniref:Uncharacterized protein n=1 Tax=Candidatus Gottesmanbacteria bacterium GW2011_GWB1_49_7 TaxID=1618448 RepID=A0A0G1W3L7_9BACT|nr:MAG: hypothetical protein UY48_C0004G0025 [Candidatus Gottesmanbacteria bacterium GW2011_GWB1_49_7]
MTFGNPDSVNGISFNPAIAESATKSWVYISVVHYQIDDK